MSGMMIPTFFVVLAIPSLMGLLSREAREYIDSGSNSKNDTLGELYP
ncbi:MAG: hypothetical protein HQK53_17810 [Oligoflexia bacterium]|nr:hypothetical protein [Oligoflexia bacterium]